jgi:hypothetical protein
MLVFKTLTRGNTVVITWNFGFLPEYALHYASRCAFVLLFSWHFGPIFFVERSRLPVVVNFDSMMIDPKEGRAMHFLHD